MHCKKDFDTLMEKTALMALATSVDGCPNVRVVNFCYDIKRPGVVYFSTCRDNAKVMEFVKNNNVAFTTIPTEGISHVRVQNAQVKKSSYTANDLQELFVSQIHDFAETLAEIGDELEFYEIHMKSAVITLGYEEQKIINF